MTYPVGRLHEEIAYIAYHFHWPREEIVDLEHHERQAWVTEIARINTRMNEGGMTNGHAGPIPAPLLQFLSSTED